MEPVICIINKCSALEKSILYKVSCCGPISKPELLKQLNLKHATLTRAVSSLIGKGLLTQTETSETCNVGRKPRLLYINPSSFYLLGVDITRMYLGIILTDACMNIIEYFEYELEGNATPEFIIKKVTSQIKYLFTKHSIDRKKILSLGIGAVGKLQKSDGVIVYADNFGTQWSNIPIKERLKKEFGLPVMLENGANAAAFAEYTLGSLRQCSHILFVSIGVGIRCGVVNDGIIIQNMNNIDSTYGHIVIEPSGKKCACGNFGCMVMYSTTKPIVEEYKKISKLHNTGLVSDDIENLKFTDVIDFSKKGDINAENIVTNAAIYMGIGLANIISILNPEVIALGGPIIERSELYYKKVVEIAKSRIYKIEDRNLTFIKSHFAKEAVSLGICAIMLEQAFGKKQI